MPSAFALYRDSGCGCGFAQPRPCRGVSLHLNSTAAVSDDVRACLPCRRRWTGLRTDLQRKNRRALFLARSVRALATALDAHPHLRFPRRRLQRRLPPTASLTRRARRVPPPPSPQTLVVIVINSIVSAYQCFRLYYGGLKTVSTFLISLYSTVTLCWSQFGVMSKAKRKDQAASLFLKEPILYNVIERAYRQSHHHDGARAPASARRRLEFSRGAGEDADTCLMRPVSVSWRAGWTPGAELVAWCFVSSKCRLSPPRRDRDGEGEAEEAQQGHERSHAGHEAQGARASELSKAPPPHRRIWPRHI